MASRARVPKNVSTIDGKRHVPAVLDHAALHEPAHRVIRLVALTLLTSAEDTCRTLEASADALREGGTTGADSLHDFRVALRRVRSWLRAFDPWLKESLPRKHRRRLSTIVRATNAAREASVHAAWIAAERRGRSATRRDGYSWLHERLQEQRVEASDDAIAAAKKFDRIAPTLRRRLELRYVHECDDERDFGAALADAINNAAGVLQARLAEIHQFRDVDEAHRARIAAKRLRYIIEPVATLGKGGEQLVTTLKRLQDSFGDLHDVHVFSSQLARVSQKGFKGTRRSPRDNPQPGLLDLARRLQSRGARVYAGITRQWLSGREAAFFRRVRTFANELSSDSHALVS